MSDAQRFDSDPTRPVTCRVCALKGVDYRTEAKRLTGHLGGAHRKDGWNKAKYIARFADAGAAQDFANYKPSDEERAISRAAVQKFNEPKAEVVPDDESAESAATGDNPLDSLVGANRELLTPQERQFYDDFFNIVLQAVDRDELQIPAISSLAFDIVLAKRMRNTQFQSKKYNKDLEAAIKAAESRVESQMTALGISRAAQLKNKVNLKSTPSSLISGYLDDIERMSPEGLDTLRHEEQRVLARMQPRVEKMILANAPDLQDDEQGTDESTDNVVLTLDEALRRANLAV